jgi:hypothetical protein
MRIKATMAGLICVLSIPQASAQQDQANIQIIAQAQDRCMATHAVRLTKTDASDENIYAQATSSCRSLNEQLVAAIKAQLPPEEAAEILGQLQTQAKPNFMSMLTKIRADRARRSGG